MLFKKEWLQENVAYSSVGDIVIEHKICGHSRWSVSHSAVFKFDGKFYTTRYSVGATESQDESPYEYEKEDIECKEVFPVKKEITVYE